MGLFRFRVMREMLDENQHRRFPLTDSAAALSSDGLYALPDAALVDAMFCMPYDTPLLLSHVRAYGDGIEFSFTAEAAGRVVLRSGRIPVAAPLNSGHTLSPVAFGDAYDLCSGMLVVGDLSQACLKVGSWPFGVDSPVAPTRVYIHPHALKAFKVGNSVVGGVLTLRAGSNVSLSSNQRGAGEPPPAESLVEVSAACPNPEDSCLTPCIRTINNYAPDAVGNFNIKGGNGISVSSSQSALSIDSTCAAPCADKSSLTDIHAAVSALNDRYARIEQFHDSLKSAMSQLQALVAASAGG